MRLTAREQERYARHLLLDGLGGEGQERLLAARLRVRGGGVAARWAARYLAASGVGALALDDAESAGECRALSPDLHLVADATADVMVEDEGEGPAAAALRGAWAALRAM